jgi:hypothetical protein
MKRFASISLFVFLLIFSTSGSNLFAQKADTVTVITQLPGDLYKFILGDTTVTGQRTNPNRFYRLERGKVYVVNATMYFNYNVNLIADEDDPNNPKRPPMLINGKLADGSNNMILIALMTKNTKYLIKNIFLQGVSTTRTQGDWNNAISVAADSVKLTLDGCVFNGFGASCVVMWSKDNTLIVRNCIFRNLVIEHPFGGQLLVNSGALQQDTFIVTNNTSFNNNSYFWAPLQVVVKYEKIEHNTLFTSMVNVFYSPWMVNAEIKSNVFYGMLAYGQKQSEISGGWYDFNSSVSSVISIVKGSSFIFGKAGITEASRKVNISNNVYYWPQKMKDYWASDPALVASDLWMNTRTQGMFDDNTNYPELVSENNISADPQFNEAMESWVVDSVIYWADNMRTNSASTFRNYNIGSTDLLIPSWPLPEKLRYSNSQLFTAGHDGLPVGDLNWFPKEKNQWNILNGFPEDKIILNVQDNKLTGPELYLTNYPNPFNLTTTFSFDLPASGNACLQIYNAQGKLVATLLNSKFEKGNHSIDFDARDLSAGLYFYQLQFNNHSVANKMIINK